MSQLRSLLEEQNFYRIPLKRLATGHYKFSVKVNGILGDFILDTGASTSCIGLVSIPFFNLLSEESDIKAAGAGAVNMETRLARKNNLTIGKKEVRNVAFILFDLSHVNEGLTQADEPHIHGIIGADLLKKFRAVIDYGRNSLFIK